MDKELELEMINSAIFAEKLVDGRKFFGKYCALYPFTTAIPLARNSFKARTKVILLISYFSQKSLWNCA